jgi:hypothetical protein
MGPSNYKVTFVVHISLMAALINLHWYVHNSLHLCNAVFEDVHVYWKLVCAS